MIKIKGLTFSYGDSAPVISGLDLNIQSGEFVTILGPSGCGKSTLLRIISHLDTCDEDAYCVGPDKNKIRMMFQDYALFPWRTCIENVILGMNNLEISLAEKRELAQSWLGTLELSGHEHKYPKELSGGMMQRAALAQALSANAELILMDEPFGALDNQMRENLQVLINKVWQEHKKTIIFVTHSVREAVFLGNRSILFGHQLKKVIDVETPVTDNLMDSRLIALETKIREEFKNGGSFHV